LSNTYEQICVEANDVWKTAFATVFGTFLSHVMQQGDCNAPATFQWLMTVTFRKHLGKFIHVYLDDIFVFSFTIEEHERHLQAIFDKLRDVKLYLEKSKLDLYSTAMDCLGHIIDEWRTPHDKHDVQQFLGLVQYLSHFMPDVMAWTGPLATLAGEKSIFLWKPMHQTCFNNIKQLATKLPILKPVNFNNPDPVWVICNASASGVGAVYGQGPEWRTCRPAGFMLKKFTNTQQSYRVFEMEMLAILEALLKWEDKLISCCIHVVTNHRTLEFFKCQPKLSNRQMCWMEFLSRFDFDIRYIKGPDNEVADSLSWYYRNDTKEDNMPFHCYVNTDIRLDPEGDDLPWGRMPEICTMVVGELNDRVLKDKKEDHDLEAQKLAIDSQQETKNKVEAEKINNSINDPTIVEGMSEGPILSTYMNKAKNFVKHIKQGYNDDSLFSKILENPKHYKQFCYEKELLYVNNRIQELVLCIPRVITKEYSLTAQVIEQAHIIVGHYGPQKTANYIHHWYWWP